MSTGPPEILARRDGRRAPIDWRTGDYQSYLESMIQAAWSAVAPEGPKAGQRPLERLNVAESDNFALGLLQCFASVGEILSFYNERIVNEGYVGTGQERRSLIELVRLLGYQVRPGVSANILLSIEPAEQPGVVGDPIVPTGTRIQSIPEPGAAPQIFETSESIAVRPEWTEVKVDLKKEKLGIPQKTCELHVTGTHTGLSAGDSVLLIPRHAPPAALDPFPWGWFATLKDVQAVNEANYTRLVLQTYPDDKLNPDKWKGGTFSIVTFRRTAALFGHNAPEWNTLPDEVKAANGGTTAGGVVFMDSSGTDGNAGLPLVRVNDVSARAVLASSKGTFFAATASGVYRRTRTDTAWKKVNDGLASPNIYSLAEAPDGSLLAGGIGAVFRSGDQGESWEFLTGPVQLKVTKQGKDETTYTAAAPLQLPPVGVRCLAANSTGVFAGTDSGAYFIAPGGSWTPVAIIPGEQVPVTALFTASDGTIFAGTSKGIFRLSGKSWTAANSGLPSPPSDPVVFAPGVAGVGSSIYSFSSSPLPDWTVLATLPEPIRSLARAQNGKLYVGTDAHLYALEPNSTAAVVVAPAAVKSVATGPGTSVVAVQPYRGIVETEWPDPELPNFSWSAGTGPKDLDIDAVDGRIAPDSYVLLHGRSRTALRFSRYFVPAMFHRPLFESS